MVGHCMVVLFFVAQCFFTKSARVFFGHMFVLKSARFFLAWSFFFQNLLVDFFAFATLFQFALVCAILRSFCANLRSFCTLVCRPNLLVFLKSARIFFVPGVFFKICSFFFVPCLFSQNLLVFFVPSVQALCFCTLLL